VLRTEDGRISRSLESNVLALEASTWRRRQDNPSLTIDEARNMEHGSVIAKWLANHQGFARAYPNKPNDHEFTQTHYDTALRYHELHNAYLGCIEAKRARSSSDFTGRGGHDGRDPFDRELERKNRLIETSYKDARRAVLESGPMGMMAVETIVLENRESERLRPDLRVALNRLAVLWKMQQAA
jgi:hypothetical protein